ncbi:hypothetical protein B0H67DRAFT_262869 [Lasiosphaeris hirsuta]|uniref:Uncharacterized protein n=1 Tax=Lasiosphaeris hirsuta TaxID=260670 RepID=A0AA40A7B1_9PEZI|nr:hypothetical protein B0H67DRAFT_262869 [Lasiosphaeris hirsuta]
MADLTSTLSVIPSANYPMFVALRSASSHRHFPSWLPKIRSDIVRTKSPYVRVLYVIRGPALDHPCERCCPSRAVLLAVRERLLLRPPLPPGFIGPAAEVLRQLLSRLHVGRSPLDAQRLQALAQRLRDTLVGDVVRGVEVGLDGEDHVMGRAHFGSM